MCVTASPTGLFEDNILKYLLHCKIPGNDQHIIMITRVVVVVSFCCCWSRGRGGGREGHGVKRLILYTVLYPLFSFCRV